jgi:hypothetical protein
MTAAISGQHALGAAEGSCVSQVPQHRARHDGDQRRTQLRFAQLLRTLAL